MPDQLHGFSRGDLVCIADGLEAGYDKTVNVGDATGEGLGDTLLESTTAAAARFIRAALAVDGDAWVAQVVSSGPLANLPCLEWRSADVSLCTAIGAKLYLAAGVPAVEATKRGAAARVMSDIEAGRSAFRQGKPREGMLNESACIGWDEAAHDAGVLASQEPKGNRCGCNHWMTPKCPSRNCPWQGKRPVDSGVASVPPTGDGGVNG